MSFYVCDDELDDSFFNKCRIEHPLGVGAAIAKVIQQFTSTHLLATFSVILIVMLPFLFFDANLQLYSEVTIRRFHKLRINILNFIHRLGYSMLLALPLFLLFNQKTPCDCDQHYRPDSHIANIIYGMPSVEALTGGLLGSWLLDSPPIFPIASRICAIFGMIWTSSAVAILGYSSIGQTVVGVLMGIILHFYSSRMPQLFVFVDAFIEIILGITFVKLDPTTYSKSDPANLKWLLIWGIAFEMFTCLMIFRHYKSYETLPHLKLSLRNINATVYRQNRNEGSERVDAVALEDTETTQRNELEDTQLTDELIHIDFLKLSDILYNLTFLALLAALLFLAFLTQHFAW